MPRISSLLWTYEKNMDHLTRESYGLIRDNDLRNETVKSGDSFVQCYVSSGYSDRTALFTLGAPQAFITLILRCQLEV